MNKPLRDPLAQGGSSSPRSRILKTQVGDVEILEPCFDELPNALKQLPFGFWTAEPELDEHGKQKCKPNGRPRIKKAPRNSRGELISKSKRHQWTSFDKCAGSHDSQRFHGVGVLLEASSGIVGIDLDDYADMKADIPAIVDLLQRAKQAGIYCEMSPSKTGLRLFVKGSLPDKGRRSKGIEIYADAAFLTVTGVTCWQGDVVDGQWLVDELLGLIARNPSQSSTVEVESIKRPTRPADPDIVDRLSKDMEQQQPRLWRGQWKQSSNMLDAKQYDSQSEADYALCGHILRRAVELGVANDALEATITTVFLGSDLYRAEKENTLRNHTVPNIIKSHIQAGALASTVDWKELKPLPSPLPPAPTFDLELLPNALRGFVADVAGRMQIPAEIIATPLLISLGSTIGKKLAVQPRGTDPTWFEYPNLWGAAILEPGMLKSPALNEATQFIRELEEQGRIEHETAMAQWKADEALRKILEKDQNSEVKKLYKEGAVYEARQIVESSQQAQVPPARRRYVITDATPEARLRILGENPNGVMLIRDELSGHIAQLHRDGFEQARSQELQLFDAKFNYEDDRLKREGMFATQPRMSIYGNLQPSKVEAILYERSQSGKGLDDGYVERLFQLAVMSVFATDYTITKTAPDNEAEKLVRSVFKAADDIGIETEGMFGHIGPIKLKFEPKAEQQFDTAFEALERILRKPGGQEHLKSHMGKFRGTIVKLALILAFCEDTKLTAIPLNALRQAIKLANFYLKHAKRIYALGQPSDLASAHELLGHIKAAQLSDGFAPRDVEMRKWKRLKTLGEIEGAIKVLCGHGLLWEVCNKSTGGAPSRKFYLNPAIECKIPGQSA